MDKEVTNDKAYLPKLVIQADQSETAASDHVVMDNQGEHARFLLGQVLELGHLEAQVTLTEDSADEIGLAISGTDAGILVGMHGQTLDALQYLLSLMVNKERYGRARITIDSDGYRERRSTTLTKFAQSLAEQVVSTGQEAITDPLSPLERRIIHTALSENIGIRTYSEGLEPNRYVVVSPKDSDAVVAE